MSSCQFPFDHLCKLVRAAAKLKKEWIEKAKVRSQWKSQKRKGDTAYTSMPRDAPPHQIKEGTDAGNDRDEEMEGRDRSGDEFQGFSAEEEPMTTSVTKIKEGKDKEGKGESPVCAREQVQFPVQRHTARCNNTPQVLQGAFALGFQKATIRYSCKRGRNKTFSTRIVSHSIFASVAAQCQVKSATSTPRFS